MIPVVLVGELSERPRAVLLEVQETSGVQTESRTAAGKVEKNGAVPEVRPAEAAEMLRRAGMCSD